ncbi:hypothetical protein GNP84_18945 [Aliivibrio fischeri]|uniref:hypothetical protein n=1 Tax=Aliivibrio fischeri TaxID=668 RepID=UPI0012D9666F|nr:hypothetical protein [Aliivibrio fischeri]MUK78960.1 hypothetical protein [Aliivibrio fischeri]
MKLSIRRDGSEKLGTFYGLYIGADLIHYEFSRKAAENVLNEILLGNTLYEVLFEQIKTFCNKTSSVEITRLKICLEQQRKEIDKLKAEIATLKKIESDSNKNGVEISNKLLGLDISNLEEQVSTQKYSSTLLQTKYDLSQLDADELSELLNEMASKNFTYSSELSGYIKKHRLGKKYPNIAGVVTMQNSSDTWQFWGGFPKNIYRIVCQELNLTDKGTNAQAIDFLSYRDIQ